MKLARAMNVCFLLEQPVHAASGGMESLDRFKEMIRDQVAEFSACTHVLLCMCNRRTYWTVAFQRVVVND